MRITIGPYIKCPPLPQALTKGFVDPSCPVVIILASGSEVRGFEPGRGPWTFSERKNSEYNFLRKGSKAVSPVSEVKPWVPCRSSNNNSSSKKNKKKNKNNKKNYKNNKNNKDIFTKVGLTAS